MTNTKINQYNINTNSMKKYTLKYRLTNCHFRIVYRNYLSLNSNLAHPLHWPT